VNNSLIISLVSINLRFWNSISFYR